MRDNIWHDVKKYGIAYLWVAPFFVVFGIFLAFPIGFSFILSFSKWQLTGQPHFTGLSNYIHLFQDEYFWICVKNNFYYWAVLVLPKVFITLVLAAILNSPRVKLGGLFRLCIILPFVASTVFVAFLFKILLAHHGGWINVVLDRFLGIGPIPWLVSAKWSKISVLMLSYWVETGYFTIIMLGGLQQIPKDLYEAAMMDGSSRLQSFFRITIPLVQPTAIFVLILSTVWTFRMFVGPLILTDGGPRYSSAPLQLLLYQNAFSYFKMGYASSLAIVIFGIVGIVSFLEIRYFRLRR